MHIIDATHLTTPIHAIQSLVQMVRQRVYQIAAGHEESNDADYLRIDPALRLPLDNGHKAGASRPLSLLKNDALGNAVGLEALDAPLPLKLFNTYTFSSSQGQGRSDDI